MSCRHSELILCIFLFQNIHQQTITGNIWYRWYCLNKFKITNVQSSWRHLSHLQRISVPQIPDCLPISLAQTDNGRQGCPPRVAAIVQDRFSRRTSSAVENCLPDFTTPEGFVRMEHVVQMETHKNTFQVYYKILPNLYGYCKN